MGDSVNKTPSKTNWVRTFAGPILVLFLLLGCYSTWSYARFGNLTDGMYSLYGYKLAPVESEVFAGKCISGGEVKSTFLLKNLTSEPIRIIGYQPDCSCVSSSSRFPIKVNPFSVAGLEMSFTPQIVSKDKDLYESHKILIHLDTDSYPITLAQTAIVCTKEPDSKNEKLYTD